MHINKNKNNYSKLWAKRLLLKKFKNKIFKNKKSKNKKQKRFQIKKLGKSILKNEQKIQSQN